ncbi:MAG TPA: hypothetical protein V6D47_08640 [Oscillatoriaceae cyanobacterium]
MRSCRLLIGIALLAGACTARPFGRSAAVVDPAWQSSGMPALVEQVSSPRPSTSPVPFAPRGSAIPLAPSAAKRPLPAGLLAQLIGVPPGTIAALIGESGQESYDHLEQEAPAALARMQKLAGGKDRLIAYLDARDTLMALVDVTSAGPGGSDVVVYDRGANTIQIPAGLNTPADEIAAFPAVFDHFMYYVTNQQGMAQLWRYDLLAQTANPLPVVNDGNPIVFPSAGLAKRLVAYQELTPAGPRLRIYDAYADTRLIPAAMQNEPCQIPRIDVFEQQVIYGTTTPHGRQVLRVYHLDTGAIETPPFLNAAGNAAQACFSFDSQQVVFVSDRDGNPDLYLADLRTGFTECLALANSPAIESFPRFIGADEIVFISTRTGQAAYYTYRLDTHALEPLPVTNWLPPPRSVSPSTLAE